MKHGADVGETPDVTAYVFAVARALNTDTIRRWDEVSFDAVVVVSKQFRYYSGRDILIAWNHHFGWSLGIDGQRCDRVLVISGLGTGPTANGRSGGDGPPVCGWGSGASSRSG